MRMEYVETLLTQYRNRGILIDANLLLLFFVGMYDRRRVSSFKGTKKFTVEDFDLLKQMFSYFNKVITTPNILTEVSNLSNQLREDEKDSYHTSFAMRIASFDERYTTSVEICAREYFSKFGLTDSGVIELVRGKYLVLTDDFKLSNYLQKANIDVINFNHIRTINWTN